MTYLLHKHLQHWNEKFTMLHTFLWLPWGFCLHLMKTFLLPSQWQAVCERGRFLKWAQEKYVRIFLMCRVQLIARHLRIYKSWTCFQTQQKTSQLKIHFRKCSTLTNLINVENGIYKEGGQNLFLFTMSWGPGNHQMSPPGCRPPFLKPKLHKESKNGFKPFHY